MSSFPPKFAVGDRVILVAADIEGEVTAVDVPRDIYSVRFKGFDSGYPRVALRRVLDIEGDPITDGDGNNVCQGCSDCEVVGVRWPSDVGGDTSRSWVERCDYCERYESDVDAARAVIAAGYGINIGFSIPMGCRGSTPYVVGVWHRPG